MRLVFGSDTHQGQLRGNNEDWYLVDPEHTLYAVADGMGGHRGGEVASHTAIEALRAAFASGDTIEGSIVAANTAVRTRAAGDDALTGMGTTLTALTTTGSRQLLFGHVGDSRAYLLRDGALRRITDDHSLVEELVRDGRLTPEQAESHPQRAIVTRALGVDPDVEVDVYTIDAETGDRVLLCSDGLTTMLRDGDVERIARNEQDPQRAAELLVATANDAGGEDNITVIIVDVADVEADEEPTATIVEPPPAATPEPTPRPRRRPMRAVRNALLVILPLLLVLAVAAGVLGWYARRSYFVGAAGAEVVIYKGVPGGVLGWDPTIDERTGLRLEDLDEAQRDRVETNSVRGSQATVDRFVARLRAPAEPPTTTTLRPRTTTTTRPRTTTTVRRRTPITARPRTTTTRVVP
jgi:protein phosphatase